MCDSVYSTPQSVTSRKAPNKRRALDPQPRKSYSSPFQVVDLSNESSEELKNRLLESENVIQDLRAERDALQETLVDKAGLNESVIIERSNRVSTQETRIFRRDMTVLEDDLKQKQSQIRILQDRCSALELEKQRMTDTLKTGEDDKKEGDEQLDILRMRIHELEKENLSKSEEIYQINGQLQRMTEKWKDLSEDYNRTMAEMTSEKKALEQRLDKYRNQLKENDRKSLVENREQENTKQVLSEVRQLSDRLEYLTPARKDPKKKERDDFLQLSAKVIEETMGDLKRKTARLDQELKEKNELVKSTKEELDALKQSMAAAIGDSDTAASYLREENRKMALQKADLRCELLEERRKFATFNEEKEKLEKQRDDALREVERITELKKSVEQELGEFTILATQRERQIEELESKIAGLEVIKREHDSMKSELTKTHEKLNQMGRHLEMADKQCTHFKSLKETAEGSRRRAIEQCNDMVVRIRNLEASLENQRKVEQELETLRAENSRQAQKIVYMKEEIQEAHMDYRQELSALAQKRGEERRNEENADHLRLTLSKKESELRSAKKTIEEVKADNQKVQQMLDEVRRQQDEILNENVRLRQGLADALKKIEEYKQNWQNSQEKCERLERENADFEVRVNKLEEELQEKNQQVAESEETVAYLHTQINAKQNKQPKLGRRSTLLSTVSEMDTSLYQREAHAMQELEAERDRLRGNLAEKRRLLAAKSQSTANTTTVTTVTTMEVSKTSQSASELSNRPGVMRHDIPHKWSDTRNIGVFSIKCSLCFEGIASFFRMKRCRHCDIQVHAACAPRVNNTCGMPLECATYYQENQTTESDVSEGRMNGWLRVYQDDVPGSTWVQAWARMDLTRIAFYNNGATDMDKPFLWIDLNQEQWVLRTGQEMPIDCDDSRANSTLMIKMPRRSLYILVPSQKVAQRWAACLQTAQRKRMMLDSKNKPMSIAESNLLLPLNSPNNLKIYKAVNIEDWILMATQTGLFFTSISQPRIPLRIAGLNSVTSLEIMSEINCVAMIVNQKHQLALIPLDSLTLAMQSTQPSIRPEILPDLRNIHAVRYHQQSGTDQRYLLFSDDTHLHIRKFSKTKDVFSSFVKFDVPEPVTFIESTPNGIIFASDTFYYVPLDSASSVPHPRHLMPPRPADYPISALLISPDEVLLAYQNHGIFVNLRGEVTRKSIIEWEKMPMEFAYSAPLLYVVHDDSIEILEVSKSREETIMDGKEVFECVNAHIIGRQYKGVLISVSSEEATEVHRFSTTNGYKNRSAISK